MTTSEFLAQMKLLDPALSGRGKEIADDAGVSYGTYLNYRAGRGNDAETLDKILKASKKIALEVKHHLNSINI